MNKNQNDMNTIGAIKMESPKEEPATEYRNAMGMLVNLLTTKKIIPPSATVSEAIALLLEENAAAEQVCKDARAYAKTREVARKSIPVFDEYKKVVSEDLDRALDIYYWLNGRDYPNSRLKSPDADTGREEKEAGSDKGK